ncbi:sigma 54-interacting transcriptional regulator [Natroniella sulfidigena]|uniref:sigma-54 interaction domain-containing protein n=1 Tax=Natroniella sulfidigena TaxID=723921 RepID=UPI00200A2BAD|nr:sigma 54-interacting transcriptional regulator [Natroniella sulfidigena]MCK8817537.1 sigma 54-interacting transcriptional regulator [Natroniella sulfidigena]
MPISHRELLNKALLEGIPGGVVVVDNDEKIVAINDFALDLLGIETDQVVGDNIAEVISTTRIDQVLQTGQAELNRYQIIGGTKILTNRIPIFEQEQVVAVVAYFQKIKEAEEMAEKLKSVQRLKKTLEAILNSIDDGIRVVDEEGRIKVYNSKMADLENLEREQVINKKLLDILPSLSRETSTIMRTLNSQESVMEHQQSYINYKGEEITTINKTLPMMLEDEFIGALEIAKDVTQLKELSEKVIDLQSELYDTEEKKEEFNNGTNYVFSDIIGENKGLKQKIKYAKRAARTSSSILISGETGTGKELFAQSIHNASRRRKEPFIAQNCAALPKDLLEGILFGTKKGGFTGAVNRQGLFEQVDGGTLLLDEINSMPLELQAKLLRVLQEGIIRPIGGDKGVRVDVRIIATINKNPLQAIEEGELREDLYYRLAVVNLELPPLRERTDDISLLVDYFIEKFNRKFNYQIQGIEQEAEDYFLNYSWPGNVRQLEHVLEGVINILDRDDKISKEDVELFMLDTKGEIETNKIDLKEDDSLPNIIEDIEKNLIKEAIDNNNNNISQAARELGIKRQTLQYKIKKYQL